MSDTSQVSSTLDVVNKYTELVKASLGGDSVYIRAKETIEELLQDGDIDGAKKADIISNVIAGAVNGITGSAMSSALQWSNQEKELALKKLEMDEQLKILKKESELKDTQIEKLKTETRLALVESRRMFGAGVFDANGNLASLAEDGKVWNDMLLTTQQTLNSAAEKDLLESKLKESAVAIHKVVADTYTNFGAYSFVLDAGGNGISSVTRKDSSTSLSDTQQDIAIEQGKGYTYNAWANALTGSASMLGTAIASGVFEFRAGSNEIRLFDAVVTCAENLSAASGTSTEATP